jgi:glycine C-acetyltransferase
VVIGGRRLVNLSSNDYLGLTTHPRLVQAAIDGARRWGAGSGAVRTIAGTQAIHEQFEARLAAFKRTEAALSFQSGYTVNVGVLSAMLEEGDVVISDKLNHASIVDGIRLTKADRILYEHCDLDDAERALAQAKSHEYRRTLLVTDGVFSMDGDIAPLPGLVERAEHYGAVVMVDDAHATGVLGDHGRGTTDHFGLHGRVALNIGTLSKAIGVVGGYVAASQAVRDHLIHRARPFLFSSSHPPAVVLACMAAIDVLETEPELMARLWENTRHFKQGLLDLGFDTGRSETPITPVMCGEAQTAMRLSDILLESGVFAQGIGFPTVPQGRARVRTIVTATHSREELDRALEAFADAGRRLGLLRP